MPVLAVSLYQKPEDLVGLHSLIRSFQPGYRMYLRRYSDERWKKLTPCHRSANAPDSHRSRSRGPRVRCLRLGDPELDAGVRPLAAALAAREKRVNLSGRIAAGLEKNVH